jgi:hypothetical protein
MRAATHCGTAIRLHAEQDVLHDEGDFGKYAAFLEQYLLHGVKQQLRISFNTLIMPAVRRFL